MCGNPSTLLVHVVAGGVIRRIPAERVVASDLVGREDSRGREVVTRDGKVFLNQLKAEFYDLDLRLSIMDQRGVDRQVLSPAGTEQRNQGCQCL